MYCIEVSLCSERFPSQKNVCHIGGLLNSQPEIGSRDCETGFNFPLTVIGTLLTMTELILSLLHINWTNLLSGLVDVTRQSITCPIQSSPTKNKQYLFVCVGDNTFKQFPNWFTNHKLMKVQRTKYTVIQVLLYTKKVLADIVYNIIFHIITRSILCRYESSDPIYPKWNSISMIFNTCHISRKHQIGVNKRWCQWAVHVSWIYW